MIVFFSKSEVNFCISRLISQNCFHEILYVFYIIILLLFYFSMRELQKKLESRLDNEKHPNKNKNILNHPKTEENILDHPKAEKKIMDHSRRIGILNAAKQ